MEGVNARSPAVRRIIREAREFATQPSPEYTAAPTDSDIFEWHFTLRGPPDTAYANGIYHGKITLPPAYPLRPPSFRFLTPNGRFQVNQAICLSISDFHEESWQPAWGVRTALVALRSHMESEPGGQVGGLKGSPEMRTGLAAESTEWRCDVCKKSNSEILEAVEKAWRDLGGDMLGREETKEDETKEEEKVVAEEDTQKVEEERPTPTPTQPLESAQPESQEVPRPPTLLYPIIQPPRPSTPQTDSTANIPEPLPPLAFRDPPVALPIPYFPNSDPPDLSAASLPAYYRHQSYTLHQNVQEQIAAHFTRYTAAYPMNEDLNSRLTAQVQWAEDLADYADTLERVIQEGVSDEWLTEVRRSEWHVQRGISDGSIRVFPGVSEERAVARQARRRRAVQGVHGAGVLVDFPDGALQVSLAGLVVLLAVVLWQMGWIGWFLDVAGL